MSGDTSNLLVLAAVHREKWAHKEKTERHSIPDEVVQDCKAGARQDGKLEVQKAVLRSIVPFLTHTDTQASKKKKIKPRFTNPSPAAAIRHATPEHEDIRHQQAYLDLKGSLKRIMYTR